MAVLPELQITDSSEALLTGRKPPFRLLVTAVAADDTGSTLPAFAYGVSEDFVVSLGRSRVREHVHGACGVSEDFEISPRECSGSAISGK